MYYINVVSRLLRMLAIGAASGLIAGFGWGLGARLAMRIMAIAADRPTAFTLERTSFILLSGMFFGVPIGLIYCVVRKLVPGSGLRKGLSYGIVVLVCLAYPFYMGPLREEAVLGYQWLAIILFGGLFLIVGIVVAAVFAWLDRVVPGSARRGTNMARLSS